jgi:GDSL-like lipase/acylhydrolase family protein
VTAPAAAPLRPRLSRSKRLIFATAVVLVALFVPAAALLGVDLYLHTKYQKTAGFNVWGYRGPVVGRKQPGEYRVAVLGGSSAFGYGVPVEASFPAILAQRLRARSPRPISVVNLGYNNEGAYSMKFTLEDYAYLHYDLVCLYEGYNDLNMVNLSVFRHDSPVFRLTGYLPIFPIIFKEKAAAMLHGGDTGALYRNDDRPVFSATIAQRAAAGMLDTTAAVAQSLERQLDRMTREPKRQVVAASTTGCRPPWQEYCRSIRVAIDEATRRGAQVLVITQPFEIGKVRARHQSQQRELQEMLARESADPAVRYVNLGDAVDLADGALSYDTMHLTERGNQRIADALVRPVLEMAAQRASAQ